MHPLYPTCLLTQVWGQRAGRRGLVARFALFSGWIELRISYYESAKLSNVI